MGKYYELAEDVIKNVGGKENVAGLVHCITRLRFTLKDEDKANDEVLKAMDGIVTVMKSGGQYQVVIGNHVAEVYDDVCAVLGIKEGDGSDPELKKGKILDRAIDVVSGIFQPILGIMAACGMLKGFNTLFATLGLYSTTDGIYLIINAAGDALFNFLPLFLGYTAAKKFKLKPMLGLAIGAALCYPAIQAGALSAAGDPLYTLFEGTMFASPVYIEFFGLPVIAIDYTGTVIPVILSVWFAAKCEKFFNRIVPELVKFFFVPMLTILITLPVTLMLLGPIATYGSMLISEFTLTIRGFSPLVAGAVVGLTWQILVIFGMHWGFIPVYINNVMTLGYDNVMMPFFACTFATSAVVLAIFFKTEDKKLKEMAIPNFISGIFGVTEPAIYGILLPFKKPFIISCIAGGIGGAFYGHFNFRKFIMGGMGIFELPNMMNPDGSMGNIIVALVGIAISMTVGFVLTMVFYRDPKKTGETVQSPREEDRKMVEIEIEKMTVSTPVSGKVIPLSEVQDEAFSAGVLGQGAAVIPEDNIIYAPSDGTIVNMFATGHAIGMLTDTGIEILIHVGMDTVQLNGRGFEPLVQTGDAVKKGQQLLKFDLKFITEAGYSPVTPVIITNSDDYNAVTMTNVGRIDVGDVLLRIS